MVEWLKELVRHSELGQVKMPSGFEVPKSQLKNLAKRMIVLDDQRFAWNKTG